MIHPHLPTNQTREHNIIHFSAFIINWCSYRVEEQFVSVLVMILKSSQKLIMFEWWNHFFTPVSGRWPPPSCHCRRRWKTWPPLPRWWSCTPYLRWFRGRYHWLWFFPQLSQPEQTRGRRAGSFLEQITGVWFTDWLLTQNFVLGVNADLDWLDRITLTFLHD